MTLQLQPVLRPRRRARTIERAVYASAVPVGLLAGILVAVWTNGAPEREPVPESVRAVPAPSRTAPSAVLVAPLSVPEAVPRVAPPEIRVREAPGPTQRPEPAPARTAVVPVPEPTSSATPEPTMQAPASTTTPEAPTSTTPPSSAPPSTTASPEPA